VFSQFHFARRPERHRRSGNDLALWSKITMMEFCNEARAAILVRFVGLRALPGQCRNHVAFFDLVATYGDWYRQALAQLVEDGCVENVARFRFLRLTDTGYSEALEWEALI
jgi:hypothetical protein